MAKNQGANISNSNGALDGKGISFASLKVVPTSTIQKGIDMMAMTVTKLDKDLRISASTEAIACFDDDLEELIWWAISADATTFIF
jgi:hypothetical protein